MYIIIAGGYDREVLLIFSSKLGIIIGIISSGSDVERKKKKLSDEDKYIREVMASTIICYRKPNILHSRRL